MLYPPHERFGFRPALQLLSVQLSVSFPARRIGREESGEKVQGVRIIRLVGNVSYYDLPTGRKGSGE